MSDFVHLHLHTEFSLLDGACRIDELLDEAQRLKMPALAVTEHGNMFSAVTFHDAARKRGINPILGCEVYVAPGDRRDKSGTPGETANHLVLLAENEKGFKNLIKLVSSGYTEGFYYKPRIDKQLLAQHSEGLIGLSSCLKGEVASEIRSEQAKKALAAAAQYRDILGKGNFFLEMQFQGIDEQRIVNNGLLPIARDLNMPLVVTNDVHYLRHGDHKPHDILLCIGTGKSVNDSNRLKYHGDQFFLKTAAEMALVFGDYPEAMQNTLLIAERCNVTIPSGENHLPNFAVPEGFTLDDYFEHVTRQGFAQRMERLRQLDAEGKLRHTLAEYDERLVYEIAMIKKMGYPGYFMIVWDFIRYAREQGIPVGPGRGSAAGSLAAWALRITDVDPLHYDLIFERFLNPERVSLPDIDVDFCERRRGEVIAYVTEKYGRENVSQIITFGTMKAKAVIRDVGRVMDMPYADVDRIAKQIPPALDMTLDKALAENPVLREMAKNRFARQRRPRDGQAPRRRVAQRRRPRRRRGHCARPDQRLRAALQEQPRRNHHPVGDEGGRARRPAEDGLPRPEHAHADPGRARRDQAHRAHRPRHRQHPARRCQDVSAVRGRPDLRHLPVRKLGHARDPAPRQAAAARRSDRHERALPSRPAQGRHGRRLHQSQGRPQRRQVRAGGARADPRRYLRRHRLPGTGHAHGLGARRLHDGPVRRAAQGHGQEGPQGHGQAARGLHERARWRRASARRRPARSSS